MIKKIVFKPLLKSGIFSDIKSKNMKHKHDWIYDKELDVDYCDCGVERHHKRS